MARVFVSYSRKNINFARQLVGRLQEHEMDFWVDWDDIPPTVDWMQQIQKGIEEADTFLFIISPDSIISKVCQDELGIAVKNGKRLIPIVAIEVPWDEAPAQISHLNYIFFRDTDDFDASVLKLLTAIETDYGWVQAHRRLQVKALEWQGGMRVGEVEELRLEDLDSGQKRLSVRDGKGRKARTIYLTETAIHSLQKYLAVRGEGSGDHVFLFRNAPLSKNIIRDRLKRAGGNVGVQVFPHRLRHTCATQLLNAGCRVTSIQRFLGHKELSSTMVYTCTHRRCGVRAPMIRPWQRITSLQWNALSRD